MVDKAHRITRGEGITIAVIDDGVDIHHVEFDRPGKIVAPRDETFDTDDPSPKNVDDNHGTCCAGVACASGIKKASGVAPAARLMPIRNVSELGSKDEADAIAWAVDHGADVISCSWGPEDGAWWNSRDKLHGRRHPISPLTSDAFHYAVTQGRGGKGCVIIFAAGNGNEDADLDRYINHPEVIAVSACNDRGKKSVYSDFGKCIWVCFPSNDFEAKNFRHPAPLTSGIWTTDRGGKKGYREKENFADYTDCFGGTSSAAPGVAGVCALILAANPALGWVDVKDILRLSADRIDLAKGKYNDDGHSIYYGYGRVNAGKAVEMAKRF
jgi:subtilisin family serine protease